MYAGLYVVIVAIAKRWGCSAVDIWQVLAVNEEGLQRCQEATVARGHPVT